MIISATRLALALLLLGMVTAERLSAQDMLAAARELYSSAQYDEALKVLDKLSREAASDDVRQSIDLYRTLCFFAVGRRDDADRAIETMIARNPVYRPGDDVSPRTRLAFTEARKRLLPAAAQRQYAEAKSAFDRKEFETAARMFRRVMDALDDPDIATAAKQPPLSDLRTLAAGFHDLTLKAMAPPPPPPAPAPEPAPPVKLPPRVYTADDEGVRPPVPIAQELPRFPSAVPRGGMKGMIEIVINEHGAVEAAAMIVPMKALDSAPSVIAAASTYDKTVLTAATRWKFQPATMNGVPVKFRKRIQINISATP